MIKFYLKIQNKMLTKNILYITAAVVLIFNIVIRIFKDFIITLPLSEHQMQGIVQKLVPIKLFEYCDVYILVLFVLLMFFFIGTDFTNSMEEIALASGGSKSNKFMLRKLFSLFILYLPLYLISYINIYTIYISKAHGNTSYILIPLTQIVFFSLVTNIFIISLSLFLLFITRDIAVSTTIITAYYLIEEALWRCKVMQKYGILGHLYWYEDYNIGQLYKVKLIYLLISAVLMLAVYKLSQRKRNIIRRIF